MKLSALNTDQALDVLCELTGPINNIVSDEDLVSEIGEVIDFDKDMNRYGIFLIGMDRISRIIPLLLRKHRMDVYSILAAVNHTTVAEISAQNSVVTLWQIREVFQDKELIDFFKSFEPQGHTEQSAPSADSRASA